MALDGAGFYADLLSLFADAPRIDQSRAAAQFVSGDGTPATLAMPRLAKVGPGTLIGELGVIRDVPRTKSLFAETDITCLRIGKEELLAVIENDAATAFKLLQVVAGYLPD